MVVLDEFNEPTLTLPAVGDTMTFSFPSRGPLVLDHAPVNPVEVLLAEV